jgi:putative peptidoglycan lipid II flippase
MPESDRPPDQVRDTATLATGTLVSRLLGFARDLLIAYVLGPAADAFLLAFRLPNVFRRLLAEGSLGMAHAAAEARFRAERGAAAAQNFTHSVCLRLFLLALPVCLLLLLSAPLVVFLLAPGAESAILARSADLFRLCLPYLPLSLAAAIAFAHTANTGNFLPQAWTPALFNIPLLLCASAALILRPETGTVEVLLCVGVIGGGLAQALVGLRCLGAMRFSAPDTRGITAFFLGPPEVRALLKRLPASALGAAPHQIHILAGIILASFLAPGGISALYFAERLVELPLGIAGAAVGIAALPRFSALAAAGNWHGFTETLGWSIRMGAFLSFPAAAGLFALAYPLSALLFGHGAYAGDPVTVTAAALCGYALGLPALCAARPLLAAAHALRLEKTSLKAALASLSLLIPVSIGGFLFSDGAASAALSVGLGLSAGAWCNALLLLRSVSAALRAEDRGKKDSVEAKTSTGEARRSLWKSLGACLGYLVAALVMAFCLIRAAGVAQEAGQIMGILALPGLILAAVAVWFAVFLAFRSEDARALAALFYSISWPISRVIRNSTRG